MTVAINGTNGITYNDGSLQPSAPVGRNLIINGDMQIAQRATSVTGITSTNYYTADRWRTDVTTAGTWTQTQDTDVPTGQGFANSLKLDCTTADASLASGDRIFLGQRIEGFNVQSLAKGTPTAKSITVSFWVKSNKTGTYIVELFDSDNSRQISTSYTISVADTWEKKTITNVGDTTGVLANDNGIGLMVQFWFAAGSNYQSGTLSTTWGTSTNANRAVGQVNIADSTSNYFNITGVQLETSTVATPFEHLQYGQQLALCQRYYEKSYSIDVVPTTNTALGAVTLTVNSTINGYMAGSRPFVVSKRAIPTIIIYSPAGNSGTVADGNTTNFKTGTALQTGTAGFSLQNNSGETWTPVSNLIYFHFIASAEL